MKFKLIGILLAVSLAVSFTACDSGGAASTGGDTSEASSEEDHALEIPAVVAALSEEENNVLAGEMRDGVYYNEYFGFKLTKGDGHHLTRDNDDAEDNAEPISLADAYTEGWGCISVTSAKDDWSERISVTVTAAGEDEIGKSEMELAEDYLLRMRSIDAAFDETDDINEDDGRYIETVSFAGGEHPMAFSLYEESAGASWTMVKDGFRLTINFNVIGDTDVERLFTCVEGL